MGKTLWIINHYAAPPMGRHQALAAAIESHGWRTVLLSASTSRPAEVAGRVTELDGVRCEWIGTPDYGGNGIGRVANMAAFTVRAMSKAVAKGGLPRPDVVWGSTVHPGAPLAALTVARRFKIPYIYEVRDLWPETFVAMGRLRRTSLIARGLYSFEHQTAKRADLLVSPLDGIGEYFSERYGIPESRFACIPNGIQEGRIVSQGSVDGYVAGARTVFTFAGAMGNVNGLDVLIDAFTDHAATYEKSTLQLIGDGPKRAEVEQLVNQRGLADRVIFRGWVPFEQIPDELAVSDWSVAVIDDLPEVFRYGVSYIKIPEYMAAGRPILLAANTSRDLVKQSGGGISVKPTRDALAQAFTAAALTSTDARREMASRGRAYVTEELTYELLGAALAAKLAELVS